jgi:hypothetical protein
MKHDDAMTLRTLRAELLPKQWDSLQRTLTELTSERGSGGFWEMTVQRASTEARDAPFVTARVSVAPGVDGAVTLVIYAEPGSPTAVYDQEFENWHDAELIAETIVFVLVRFHGLTLDDRVSFSAKVDPTRT